MSNAVGKVPVVTFHGCHVLCNIMHVILWGYPKYGQTPKTVAMVVVVRSCQSKQNQFVYMGNTSHVYHSYSYSPSKFANKKHIGPFKTRHTVQLAAIKFSLLHQISLQWPTWLSSGKQCRMMRVAVKGGWNEAPHHQPCWHSCALLASRSDCHLAETAFPVPHLDLWSVRAWARANLILVLREWNIRHTTLRSPSTNWLSMIILPHSKVKLLM